MKYVSASLHLCKQIICDQAGKYFGILRPGHSEIVCICNKRGGGAVKQQSEFSLIYVKLQNSIWIPEPASRSLGPRVLFWYSQFWAPAGVVS